ncbi:MAG: type II secretion system F family protein [Acetobacteraceae bacterium]|nr:type II secretion system F family protein [Acetobacteraceae bacterium]
MDWLIFLGMAGAIALLLLPVGAQGALKKRLEGLRSHPRGRPSSAGQALEEPFLMRVVVPFVDCLARGAARFTPRGSLKRLKERLARAGNPMEPGRFLAVRVLSLGTAAAALLGLYLLLGTGGQSSGRFLCLALGASACACFLPDYFLSRLIRRRQKLLLTHLPDVLDLLCVSVEAGLGFDGAVQKVAEKFPAPTRDEFREYLKEVRLGRPRADALRALAARVGLAEVQSFAAAVIQAEELGVGMSKVLRVQSEQMRRRRKQMAEEKAMKTPIKMLFPLVLFIFPTMFIVLLGPALIRLLQVFRH